MTQLDYIIVLLGYEKIYGFQGGGLKRVVKEVSEYNLYSLLGTASKISLKLFAGGFLNTKNQIQLVNDIFAGDLGVRRKIACAIRDIANKNKVPVWAIFTEQSLLCLFKVALINAQRIGGKFVYETDVQKVGHWLLILNDLCIDSELFPLIRLSSTYEEYLRANFARQHFFIIKERMPYIALLYKLWNF